MIITQIIKYKFIKLALVWFDEINVKDVDVKADIYFFVHLDRLKSANNIGGRTYLDKTAFSDLTLDEDDLFAKIEKNSRYKIKRALREGFQHKIFDSSQMLEQNDRLLEFEKEYNRMFSQKDQSSELNMEEMRQLIANGALYFSMAFFEDQPVVYHVYVRSGCKIRLLHSVSIYREAAANDMRAMIARYNRCLHWQDMSHFKKQGCDVYDWGGIGESEEFANINEFKLSFGGDIVDSYRRVCPRTILGRMITPIYCLLPR